MTWLAPIIPSKPTGNSVLLMEKTGGGNLPVTFWWGKLRIQIALLPSLLADGVFCNPLERAISGSRGSQGTGPAPRLRICECRCAISAQRFRPLEVRSVHGFGTVARWKRSPTRFAFGLRAPTAVARAVANSG